MRHLPRQGPWQIPTLRLPSLRDVPFLEKVTPSLEQAVPVSTPSGQSSKAVISRPLRTDPIMFDCNDLNFFRHFLFEAYPPLPVDGFTVWQQASQLSHEYDFLLHSMIGLGASHLGLLTPSGYEKAALKHRVIAIRALNKHLAKPGLTNRDAEAAFGAMLNLTFQSAYMDDGLIDFLTMVRGCWLVGTQSKVDMDDGIFKTFGRVSYLERVKELIQVDEASNYYLDKMIAEGFCQSVQRLGPLCYSVAELQYIAHMQRIATLASTNPAESYHELTFLYDCLGNLNSNDFASFVDTNNHASQLVIMHLLVLEFVMSRKELENNKRSVVGKKGYHCRKAMSKIWVQQILRKLPVEYYEYGEWPLKFINSLNYSFDDEDQVWKPFFLSRGRAVLPEGETISLAIR
ncbi:Sterol uptake control protein 2 [Fusarium austroafricanum]|uniref:Sterol uptake control protein 2 n=1 Tax=Fusarium austroafricanum TaxID=2364996 RepID=A0A8H4KCP3_9HYPO|nr:Sterol uptake control protein 2 [Fusarium austroafricanum]